MFDLQTPVQNLGDRYGFELLIKRDDLIHPFISGNKWRKLKYNVEHAEQGAYLGIATKGGAYSNHLIATACACAVRGLRSLGFVRGDELSARSNFVLRLCAEFGMDLHFMTREEFREFHHQADRIPDGYYFVPEGGANEAGIRGCAEIFGPETLDAGITDLVCAVGTATTLAGILLSVPEAVRVHGIAAMRQAAYLNDYLHSAGVQRKNWTLYTGFAGAGFGITGDEVFRTMKDFTASTGILLDPVYTGKLVHALPLLYRNGSLQGGRVLMLHSGGMTGILSEAWLNAL